jgi:hypothetical protein
MADFQVDKLKIREPIERSMRYMDDEADGDAGRQTRRGGQGRHHHRRSIPRPAPQGSHSHAQAKKALTVSGHAHWSGCRPRSVRGFATPDVLVERPFRVF